MTAAEWIQENQHLFSPKTPYERRYVERVLAHVDGIDWSSVAAQTAVRDSDGIERRIDFTICEGVIVRIAIEVEGYDKTGDGQGATREEHARGSAREQEIVAAGYTVIRVANRLVDREPDSCRRVVELVLKRERGVAALVAESSNPERPLSAEDHAAYAHQALSEAERRELMDSQARSIQQLRSLLAEADDARDGGEGKRKRPLVIAAVAGAVAVAIGIAVVSLLSSSGGVKEAAVGGTGGASSCAGASSWKAAASEVGRSGDFRGKVVRSFYNGGGRGQPTYLDLGRAYPDSGRLSVVIWGSSRDAFPGAPESIYRDKDVAVSGKVSVYRGVTRIIVRSPSAIATC